MEAYEKVVEMLNGLDIPFGNRGARASLDNRASR